MAEKTEFAYEEEIPLVVQIITSKNEGVSYQVDYFHSPEEYEKFGYEGIFAITVRFSQKTVGELETLSKNTSPAEPGDEGSDELPDREVSACFVKRVF